MRVGVLIRFLRRDIRLHDNFVLGFDSCRFAIALALATLLAVATLQLPLVHAHHLVLHVVHGYSFRDVDKIHWSKVRS